MKDRWKLIPTILKQLNLKKYSPVITERSIRFFDFFLVMR